jgi:hypothetical protein
MATPVLLSWLANGRPLALQTLNWLPPVRAHLIWGSKYGKSQDGRFRSIVMQRSTNFGHILPLHLKNFDVP